MNNTNNVRKQRNNGRRNKRSDGQKAAVASLVPDATSYSNFCQHSREVGDALDAIDDILSSNPRTSGMALSLKHHTSVVLPPSSHHRLNNTTPEAKSNINLMPLKLVYLGEHGLLVVIFAPLHPQTTPAAHSWLHTMLSGSALISHKLLHQNILVPMERWCSKEVSRTSKGEGGKRLREGDEEVQQGEVEVDHIPGDTTIASAHDIKIQNKHLTDTILQPIREDILGKHDYLLYSVIGAVNHKNTDNVGAHGEAAMREYMTRWKLATRGAFPVPTLSKPITTASYEEVVLALQAGCSELNDECIEWPIHGPSHPFVCQVNFLGKQFFASEFPQ